MRTAVLRDAVADSDAAAFVHVGAGPTRRYLVGAPAGPRRDALVYVDGDLILCPPHAVDPAFEGKVRPSSAPPGDRAVAVLDEYGVSGPVLAPEHVPHGAAARIEAAGYDLTASDAVAAARETKSDAERADVAAAGAAAVAGVDRARGRLAGDVPAASDLRRETAVAVVRAGADPVEIAVSAPSDPPAPAEPIVIRVVAAVDGYHALVARTVVPDPAGGWERRAHVAAEGALAGVKRQLDPGTTPAAARAEAVAELGAYGFEDVSAAVHGVGLERRERPTGDAELPAGAVLAVTLGATHEGGTVTLGDTVAVGDETATLTDAATALPP